jgi:hypothetical protein
LPVTDANDTQPGDDSPDFDAPAEAARLSREVREAMARSAPLVRDAMWLARETCRPDPMPGVVLR